MQRFSDFAQEATPLDGKKVKVDALVGCEIIITGFRLADSNFSKNKSGKYATVQFRRGEDESPEVFFTGSDILIEQVEKYADELPFLATIKKINRYYTFS